tara:strand:- start:27942 stop:28265 length:324 start_codon:yes stop_codon:yes gene_type:complete
MMETSEFYQSLTTLPVSYSWTVGDNKSITATKTRGKDRGSSVNPVTAVAQSKGLGTYGTNKRETLKAGKALGLSRTFASTAYDAATSVSNRGNAQVVRGKIRSALEI